MLQKQLAPQVFAFVLVSFVCAAPAQDTRSVTEPKVPTACVKLDAKLSATGDALRGASLGEADENKPDTQRIQQAIDSFASKCKPGTAIELAPAGKSTAFLSGPLELREGVTLLIDKGVTLFASRRAADYETAGAGTCGTMPSKGRCKPVISVRAHNVAIMGDGVIDGRGGSRLLDKDYSWWGLAVKAEPGNVPYSDPRLIDAAEADGFTLYRITLHDSPNFHVGVSRTNGFTAWGVHLRTPVHDLGPNDPRPRNTDGIDPGSSSNVTIAHNWIDNGDDNVAIKTGVTHISVLDNHFYSGHGMSIGSDTYSGDSYLLVDGLTEDHTTSGIRIKSNVTRGGLVHELTYRNICMRDVQVPIAISPYYNNGTTDQFFDPGFKGDKIPEYKNITIENVTDLTPGDILIAGYDQAHRTEINFKNVNITGLTPDKLHLKFADIGVAGTNIPFARATDQGEIKLIESKNDTPAYSCEGKFVPMR
jgi:polygalacturonase